MVKEYSIFELAGVFSSLQNRKVMLIGDYMLDHYTIGEVARVSPEAPVPILKVENENFSPGGAGNVALNLLALGAEVFTVGRIGVDESGEILKNTLQQEGAKTTFLFKDEFCPTSVKRRFLANNQQIFRADFEKVAYIDSSFEEKVLQSILPLIPEVKVIAFSDYGKGFLSDRILKTIINEAARYNVPIIVDPKGSNFRKYNGATIIKPNLSEAYAAAKKQRDVSLDEVASLILNETNIKHLFITRSEKGISLFNEKERVDFPAISREVKDVTGAGDTVLAMLSFALGNGLDIYQAAQLSNIAAGIAIERVGCAKVSLSDLATQLLNLQSDNKIFDGKHLFALKMVLQNKSFSLLGLKGKKGLDAKLFRQIRKLSQERLLVLYLVNEKRDNDFVHMLSSLKEVNFIILDSKFSNICDELKPTDIFTL